jgi:hypothetical protein
MKSPIKIIITSLIIVMSLNVSAQVEIEKYDTRIGKIEFENGFEKGVPTLESSKKLIESFDVMNATTAYSWAMPLVTFYSLFEGITKNNGVGNNDIVLFDGLNNVRPFLTSNNSTPYIMSAIDLSQTGPMVLDVPEGMLLGFIDDAWQRPIIDLGLTGLGKGQGEKIVVVGPGQDLETNGYHQVSSKTNLVFVAYRILDPDPEKAMALLNKVQHYPYHDRLMMPKSKVIIAKEENNQWAQGISGMDYWEALHEVMQREVVEERDRLFYGMLKPLGLEKGTDYLPTKEQLKILEEAAFLGEATAKAYTFNKRFDSRVWREGSQWEHLLNMNPNQREGYTDQFEGRAAFFYEATSMSVSYTQKILGTGSKYLFSYKDDDSKSLDGATNYKLHVPADVPVELFWDVSVYETRNRIYITNESGVVNIGSRTDGIKTNEDGSIDLYFGPKSPSKKLESNWIQTVSGENWFACFRFYGPLEPYYDGSFPLPNIEQAK